MQTVHYVSEACVLVGCLIEAIPCAPVAIASLNKHLYHALLPVVWRNVHVSSVKRLRLITEACQRQPSRCPLVESVKVDIPEDSPELRTILRLVSPVSFSVRTSSSSVASACFANLQTKRLVRVVVDGAPEDRPNGIGQQSWSICVRHREQLDTFMEFFTFLQRIAPNLQSLRLKDIEMPETPPADEAGPLIFPTLHHLDVDYILQWEWFARHCQCPVLQVFEATLDWENFRDNALDDIPQTIDTLHLDLSGSWEARFIAESLADASWLPALRALLVTCDGEVLAWNDENHRKVVEACAARGLELLQNHINLVDVIRSPAGRPNVSA